MLIIHHFLCAKYIRHVYTLTEDPGVAANDSDSSPPRSRGRGRFEKSRIRGVPRGQSEDARSTSSQGVDETESSSNVGPYIFFPTHSLLFEVLTAKVFILPSVTRIFLMTVFTHKKIS